MDAALEAKLKSLSDAGKKMEALHSSIAQKYELIASLENTKKHVEGMAAVTVLTQQTIDALKEEILLEEQQLKSLRSSL